MFVDFRPKLTNYLYLTSYIIKLRYRYNIEAIEKTKGF